MTELKKVRVGVVGVGALGQWHAKNYAAISGAELAGVYDIDAGRASEIAMRYNTRTFASIEELAEAVDAASVVVPPSKHFYAAGILLERGAHVLVEKPITESTREAEDIVALAERAGRILQVGHVERFNPVLAYLESILTKPRFIEAHRLAPYPPPRPGAAPRGTEVSVVLDLMIHDLEIILHLVNSELVHLHAVGVPVLSASEDIANARLSFANGCVANVTASRISPEALRKIRIFQEDAYISLDYRAQSGEIYRKAGARIEKQAVPIEKDEPLLRELSSFVECVREREAPRVGGRQAVNALKLAVQIVQKIREGGP